MTNIYLKRNELSEKSKWLRSAKFDLKVNNKRSFEIDKEQNKVYHKFNFYNKYKSNKQRKGGQKMNYYLKCYEYYLADIMTEDNKLINFSIDKDYRKMYEDFEQAEEDRKLIFIETGLNLEVKRFKKEEE